MKPIYFDYNATTPLDADAFESMLPFLSENFGNPSSIHRIGRRARVMLDQFREKAAALLGCKSHEIIFTSGGTESNNLGIFGVSRLMKRSDRNIIVTSPVEHHAALHCVEYLEKYEGFRKILIPVDRNGRVIVEELKSVLTTNADKVALVSIMAANNETGSHQPFQEIGNLCQEFGVIYHTDAAQWFGKESIDSGILFFNADLVSLCAHKFHGPKGVGILYAKSPLHPDPIIFGGGHENDRRAGTENLANIAGMIKALEKITPGPEDSMLFHWKQWIQEIRKSLAPLDGLKFWSSEENSLRNTLMFTFSNQDAISILAALDIEGICASSGSACSVGSLLPSHVLLAQGASETEAKGAIRLSIGRETTGEEIQKAISIISSTLSRIQKN